jgi:hypothetical protein
MWQDKLTPADRDPWLQGLRRVGLL